MPKRIELKVGDYVDKNNKFVLLEEPPVKRYNKTTIRRVKVKSVDTGEIFVSNLGDLRRGHTKYPPSLTKKMKAENRKKWKVGETKHIDNFDILLMFEPEPYISPNGQVIRKGHFKNLQTNQEFEDVTNHVIGGWNLGIKGLSKGEKKIKDILEENNIIFYQEYVFKDCVNPNTNTPLKFDFYLPNQNCCIEFDGEQHETGWRLSSQPKNSLKEIEFRDNIKNSYCKEKGINLWRIPYTDLSKIDHDYIMSYLNNLYRLDT